MITKSYVDVQCTKCGKPFRVREYEGLGGWYGSPCCLGAKPLSPRKLELMKKPATKTEY